jgi:hypothetical protein
MKVGLPDAVDAPTAQDARITRIHVDSIQLGA